MFTELYISILVCWLVVMAIRAYIANEFSDVAMMKGYIGPKYFFVPWLFGVMGCLYIMALPDRKHINSMEKVNETAFDDLPTL